MNARAKTVIKTTIAVVLCALSFWLGKLAATRNTIVYLVNGNRIAVNLDWPTYGLPLAEYASALSELRAGLTNEAIGFLETCLDSAVYDAQHHRPLLQAGSLAALDKSLAWVVRYRKHFPGSTNQVIDPFETVRQTEVDSFLIAISKP